LETDVYIKGSFKYLEKVGMDRTGLIKDKESPLVTRDNIKKSLLEYC
jgi:hypothetical protein